MTINLTPAAIQKISEIIAEEKIEETHLRMRVVGGGCAGFNYDLYFESNVTSMDEIFDCGIVTVCIDPLSYQYLDGTEIDFVDGLYGSGFKFVNPNVSSTCGCGQSFGV